MLIFVMSAWTVYSNYVSLKLHFSPSKQLMLLARYIKLICFFQERTRENSKEGECFRELLTSRSSEYVEEILSPHFGGLMQFVKEGEALADKNQLDELKKQESEFYAYISVT